MPGAAQVHDTTDNSAVVGVAFRCGRQLLKAPGWQDLCLWSSSEGKTKAWLSFEGPKQHPPVQQESEGLQKLRQSIKSHCCAQNDAKHSFALMIVTSPALQHSNATHYTNGCDTPAMLHQGNVQICKMALPEELGMPGPDGPAE